MSSQEKLRIDWKSTKNRADISSALREVSRRRPIFPWGCPRSIIGAEGLNCRVMNLLNQGEAEGINRQFVVETFFGVVGKIYQ